VTRSHIQQLTERLAAKRATLAVLGLGYVGLTLAAAAARAGFTVIGLDTDAARVDALRRGALPAGDVDPAALRGLLASGRFEATSDAARLADVDVFLLCVPTPLDAARRPDLTHVIAAARAAGGTLRPGALVVLESTVFPGATRQVLLPELLAAARARGLSLQLGEDLFVAHAPERVDPGRADPPPERVPRLVGGLDPASTEAAAALYTPLVERVVRCSSAEVAEAAKVFENVFRAVNIALVNELEMILAPLDVPVQEVLDAAASKPFGFMAFRPGAGAGGHCVPAAPGQLLEAARRAGVRAALVEVAAEINRRKPEWIVQRARQALAARRAEQGRPVARGEDALRGARVLVVGLAYKPGVADTRESPGLQLLSLLCAAGADVCYHDPLVPRVPEKRPAGVPELESVPLDASTLAEVEAVIVATRLPDDSPA
jgi:UDP-N-acetyl-D-glucosamine dehydrogenase